MKQVPAGIDSHDATLDDVVHGTTDDDSALVSLAEHEPQEHLEHVQHVDDVPEEDQVCAGCTHAIVSQTPCLYHNNMFQ